MTRSDKKKLEDKFQKVANEAALVKISYPEDSNDYWYHQGRYKLALALKQWAREMSFTDDAPQVEDMGR